MSRERIRRLDDADWMQLVVLASGYLPQVNGDARRAMAKALAAHQDLIVAAKQEAISAELPEGRVTLIVPDEGGMALRFESF